jgi:hypothetical protein
MKRITRLSAMTYEASLERSGQIRIASSPSNSNLVAIPRLSAIGAKKIRLSLGTVPTLFQSDTEGGLIRRSLATAAVPPNLSIRFIAFILLLLGIPYLMSIGIPYLLFIRIA